MSVNIRSCTTELCVHRTSQHTHSHTHTAGAVNQITFHHKSLLKPINLPSRRLYTEIALFSCATDVLTATIEIYTEGDMAGLRFEADVVKAYQSGGPREAFPAL